jgi:hypothetical protein
MLNSLAFFFVSVSSSQGDTTGALAADVSVFARLHTAETHDNSDAPGDSEVSGFSVSFVLLHRTQAQPARTQLTSSLFRHCRGHSILRLTIRGFTDSPVSAPQ